MHQLHVEESFSKRRKKSFNNSVQRKDFHNTIYIKKTFILLQFYTVSLQEVVLVFAVYANSQHTCQELNKDELWECEAGC